MGTKKLPSAESFFICIFTRPLSLSAIQIGDRNHRDRLLLTSLSDGNPFQGSAIDTRTFQRPSRSIIVTALPATFLFLNVIFRMTRRSSRLSVRFPGIRPSFPLARVNLVVSMSSRDVPSRLKKIRVKGNTRECEKHRASLALDLFYFSTSSIFQWILN